MNYIKDTARPDASISANYWYLKQKARNLFFFCFFCGNLHEVSHHIRLCYQWHSHRCTTHTITLVRSWFTRYRLRNQVSVCLCRGILYVCVGAKSTNPASYINGQNESASQFIINHNNKRILWIASKDLQNGTNRSEN